MKLNFAKESDIVVGRVLYSTCILRIKNGYSTDITKEIITVKPFDNGYKSIKIFDDMEFDTLTMLGDRNIPLNCYNHHHLFTDLESAELYCNMFKTQQFDHLIDIGVLSPQKIQRINENYEMYMFHCTYRDN